MTMLKKSALGIAIAAVLGSAPLMAHEAGDAIVRVGLAGVLPNGESENLAAVPSGKVEADDAYSLGITFTYMVTDQIGIGVLGAWPFEHDIEPKGSALTAITGDNDVASTKHLPPTVTVQWYPPLGGSNFHPYIGAGINYTYFFDEDTKGALSDADIDIDNSVGLAFEAGVDYSFNNGWLASLQVWYANIEPEAEITGGALSLNEDLDVEIDPWIFVASVGKKF